MDDQTTQPAVSPEPAEDAPEGRIKPLVVKTKKKKKYSRGLKGLQQSGQRMSKLSSRMLRSVSDGMDTFRKQSKKSAGKKRDGALLDFNRNLAKGMSKSLRSASSMPYDLAKALEVSGSRKRTRRQVKMAARIAKLMRVR